MIQCNCDENAENYCALGHLDGDEIIGYIAPCGQQHYCRIAGDVLPDCESYYCHHHNAEGLPYDGNQPAYVLRLEIAKRDRGEPYSVGTIAEIEEFQSRGRPDAESKYELLREVRYELQSKLGDLPEYALDYMARERQWVGYLQDRTWRLAELLHRDCPDNRALHRQGSREMFCCQSCYTDADGNAYHCPLEVQIKRERAEGRYPKWPPRGGWGTEHDEDE